MCGFCESERYELSAARRAVLMGRGIDAMAMLEAIAKDVYKGRVPKSTDISKLIQDEYAQYRDAIQEGAGMLATSTELGSPNFKMLKNLQTNAGTFAAFKTRHQMRKLVTELRDPEGNLRSFNQYMQATKSINENYKVQWAKAEYDTAVRSSRMATVWSNIQQTADIYPNIRYLRTRSANEDPQHLQWVGTVLPINHPFWSTHFPPNRWGCKCSAEPTDDFVTDVPPGMPDEGFGFNPGADGLVFNVDEHPYSKMPKKDRVQAAKEARLAMLRFELRESREAAKNAGLMSKKIKTPALQTPVTLNRNSWNKSGGNDPYFFDRINILDNIVEVLANCSYVMAENKKEKQDVRMCHVLNWTGPNNTGATLRVLEMKNGDMVLYHIHVLKSIM